MFGVSRVGILSSTLLIVALSPTIVGAAVQRAVRDVGQDGATRTVTIPTGRISQYTPDGRNLRARILDADHTVDPDSNVRIIVELDAEPVAIARIHGHDVSLPGRRIDQLRADIAGLATIARAGAAPRITREFTRAWSGAALTLPASLVDRVRALPYVRHVFRDEVVHGTLAQSVPLIRADRVQTELGGTGAGIRVGIIDTGIDYNHPAFGGGFGPGHRVAGGYDFIHNDADPMDDNGHGTHVAGIVGGNGGGILGVAPAATLYAFKVLDQNGYGYDSTVLAGLERALDPDGNSSTDDAMQVVNISLGSRPGSADSPTSLALDNLTQAGVVCVAAAGNDAWYFSIISPGASRRAITVGASTKQDSMADFSSGGPVWTTYDLKPDLVAPGVDIVSAARGGGTLSLSGTSMATPHVAGVAAQLLQLHPSWTPDQIKAAIVGSSKDLKYSPFKQGAGRVDAYAAATGTFMITPTHISYGLIDATVSTWSHTDTLHVTNLTSLSRSVSFPSSTTVTSGAVVKVTPTSISIPGGGTTNVVVNISVKNSTTPVGPDGPYGYAATIVASSGTEKHRVPVSFHKAAALYVHSSTPIDWLIIHDRQPNGFIFSDDAPQAPMLIKPGIYDVMVSFFPFQPTYRFVVRENVNANVSGTVDLGVDPADATAHFTFANVGPTGAPLNWNSGFVELYDTRSGWGPGYIGWPVQEIWSSPMSTSYHLDWTRTSTNYRDSRVDISGRLTGVTTSQAYANTPDDLRHVPIAFPQPPTHVKPLIWWYFPNHTDAGYGGYGFSDASAPAITGPFTFDWWLKPLSAEDHATRGLSIDLRQNEGGPIDLSLPVIQYGSLLRVDRGWPIEDDFMSFTNPRWGTVGGPMGLFQGLPVWRGRFLNGSYSISIDSGWDVPWGHPFADMYGTMALGPDPTFEMWQGGTFDYGDTLRGMGGFGVPGDALTVHFPNADNDFLTSRAFQVRGLPARLDVTAHMRLGKSDKNPPSLRSLQLFADDAPTDSINFATTQDAGLRFRVTDSEILIPATVSIRQGPSGAWNPVTVQRLGDEYLATLPNTLNGLIALRLMAQDATGNSLTMTWDPAFVAVPQSATDVNPSPAAFPELALIGSLPNPTTPDRLLVGFVLPSSAPARLSLIDLAGREVATQDIGGLGAGRHVVRMTGKSRVHAGIYLVRLSQAGRTLNSRICVLK